MNYNTRVFKILLKFLGVIEPDLREVEIGRDILKELFKQVTFYCNIFRVKQTRNFVIVFSDKTALYFEQLTNKTCRVYKINSKFEFTFANKIELKDSFDIVNTIKLGVNKPSLSRNYSRYYNFKPIPIKNFQKRPVLKKEEITKFKYDWYSKVYRNIFSPEMNLVRDAIDREIELRAKELKSDFTLEHVAAILEKHTNTKPPSTFPFFPPKDK